MENWTGFYTLLTTGSHIYLPRLQCHTAQKWMLHTFPLSWWHTLFNISFLVRIDYHSMPVMQPRRQHALNGACNARCVKRYTPAMTLAVMMYFSRYLLSYEIFSMMPRYFIRAMVLWPFSIYIIHARARLSITYFLRKANGRMVLLSIMNYFRVSCWKSRRYYDIPFDTWSNFTCPLHFSRTSKDFIISNTWFSRKQ